MDNWHFAPWTIQYLIGSAIVSFVLITLLRKKIRSYVYYVFYFFSMSIIMWLIFAFLHRNTSTAKFSKIFFSLDLFFVSLIIPFMLLMFLYLKKKKKLYALIPLPALIVGIAMIFFQPFDIIWAGPNLGWSYKFYNLPFLIYVINISIYSIATLYIGFRLVFKSRGIVRKKHLLILLGFLFSTTGIIISNFWLRRAPHIPPFGGFFATFMVLIIAYAINLPDDPIASKKSLGGLEASYLTFLNKLKKIIPGKELGESSFKFWDYIEAMGMREMVKINDSGTLIFDPENFGTKRIKEVSDNIIKVMKEYEWAGEAIDELSSVLLYTYKTLQIESENTASQWFFNLLEDHGGFLYSKNILSAFPENLIPEIYKELEKEACYIFIDKPGLAYDKIKRANVVGLDCLCVTKYNPVKLQKEFYIKNIDIIWLTYKNSEQAKTISPRDLTKLKNLLNHKMTDSQSLVLLLDCLKEIKLSKGFDNTLKFLAFLKNACKKNNANIFIIYERANFTKTEIDLMFNKLDIDILRNY